MEAQLSKKYEEFTNCYEKCKTVKIIKFINNLENNLDIDNFCKNNCINELLKELYSIRDDSKFT